MTIAITGSTSNLGVYLVKFLKSKKKRIIEINRKNDNFFLENSHTYNFKGKKISTLIHLAHTYTANGFNVNFEGSKKLFIKARKNNVKKIIFISSISAHIKSLSDYGKTKYKIEKFCLKNKIIILRPGIIFGGGIDKKLSLMSSLLRYFPIIPCFNNKNKFLYSVHINDLIKVIFKNIKSSKLIGNYNVFSNHKIYLKNLIDLTANKKIKIYLPYQFFYIFFTLISKILYLKSVDSFLGILGNRINYNHPDEKNIFTNKNIQKNK